jgi:secreted trypsin-like serine protease
MRRLLSIGLLASCVLAAGALGAAQSQAAPVVPRVVGGNDAAAGAWPSAAFVEYDTSGTGVGPFFDCTGTVISPHAILTAAHCAEDLTTGAPNDPAGYLVLTGSQSTAQPWPAGAQVLTVSAVDVEPAFDGTTLANDAAILQLASATTAPAMPLATSADAALADAASPATIAGWGLTSGGSSTPPSALQQAALEVQSDAACATGLASLGGGYLPASMLCTLSPQGTGNSRGGCHGDSGGPLAAQRADLTWVEIGITSWGDNLCATSTPTVFTRVTAIQPWAAATTAAIEAGPPASGGGPGSPPATPPADRTPPTLQITAAPHGRTRVAIALVGWSGGDAGGPVTFATSLDGHGFGPFTSATQQQVGPLRDGVHTLVVRARDSAGNTTDASVTWTVDRSGPSVRLVAPGRISSGTAAPFRVRASDPAGVARVTWNWGHGPRSSGLRVRHSFARTGVVTVTIVAYDRVGNSTRVTRRVHVG